MAEQLNPISKQQYHQTVRMNFSSGAVDDLQILQEAMKVVNELPKLVTGAYFWRIYSKINYCIEAGGHVQQLTPYTAEELKNSKAPDELMIAVFHPDEREMIYSFIDKFAGYINSLPQERKNKQSINLYVRIRQINNAYKWVNVQYPFLLFDSEGKGTGGLIVYTDLSQTGINFTSPEMTIIDSTTGDILRFKGAEPSIDPVINLQNKIPGLSRRQSQILYLISKGKASKEIAAELKIAKNTVENHRQRLLRKFEAKSSIELMDLLKDVLR
jgi:DNA-binding CsgD family transcriptional regulator